MTCVSCFRCKLWEKLYLAVVTMTSSWCCNIMTAMLTELLRPFWKVLLCLSLLNCLMHTVHYQYLWQNMSIELYLCSCNLYCTPLKYQWMPLFSLLRVPTQQWRVDLDTWVALVIGFVFLCSWYASGWARLTCSAFYHFALWWRGLKTLNPAHVNMWDSPETKFYCDCSC